MGLERERERVGFRVRVTCLRRASQEDASMALASSSSSSSSGPSNRFAPSGWAETPSARVGGCGGVWSSGSRVRTGE
nr:unnamed protein product [Digitaria exilis]